MPISKPVKTKKFKLWVNIFTALAMGLLILLTKDKIGEVFREIPGLNSYALLMMIPIQIGSYYSVSRLYNDFLTAVGEAHLTTKQMMRVSLELNFINNVFPSGGVSGYSYFAVRLKKYGISSSTSTLTQLMKLMMVFVSFMVLLFIGMFILTFSDKANSLLILISSSLAFLTLFGVLIVGYIISDESRIKSFSGFLPKLVNSIIRPFRKKNIDTIDIPRIEKLFTGLHEDFLKLRGNTRILFKSLAWSLVFCLAEIATIYVVFIAFGTFINPGALIIAYAAANFSGVIAILPGNVGIYETTMATVLISAGEEGALALSVTLVYRVLNMLLFLPTGYYFYHKSMQNKQTLHPPKPQDKSDV